MPPSSYRFADWLLSPEPSHLLQPIAEFRSPQAGRFGKSHKPVCYSLTADLSDAWTPGWFSIKVKGHALPIRPPSTSQYSL